MNDTTSVKENRRWLLFVVSQAVLLRELQSSYLQNQVRHQRAPPALNIGSNDSGFTEKSFEIKMSKKKTTPITFQMDQRFYYFLTVAKVNGSGVHIRFSLSSAYE